ncbi:hypothetical protein FQN60_005982 [Etheostoma spectabile]|uniref:Uncharacterized protein n=1 Tax=Etheostoma spectabile TaxID=54343 RepID=A0A5J5CF90_9PERO|nr:hypothetical protein FQN60_005982 [Etheostoma spectabile]
MVAAVAMVPLHVLRCHVHLLHSAVPSYVLLCLVMPTVPCYAMNYYKELLQTTIFSIFVISTNPNRPVRCRLPRAWVCPRFLPKREFFLTTVALLGPCKFWSVV